MPRSFNMAQLKFAEIVQHKKLSSCSSCDSHEYTLPFPMTAEISDFLAPIGALKYPLDKISLLKIENDAITVQGRVGRQVIKVKFKKDTVSKQLFEVQLAAYIGSMMQDSEIIF